MQEVEVLKLPLEVLKDNFEKNGHKLYLSHSPEALKEIDEISECPRMQQGWYGIVHYQPAEDVQELETEFLLFGNAEDFGDGIRGRGIVSAGKPSEQILAENEVLYCEELLLPQEAERFFRAVQKLFLRYEKWETSVRDVMRRDQNMEELLTYAFQVFDNPVFVHDENFNLLASVSEGENQHHWDLDKGSGKYVLPMEILNDFNVNPDYLESMSTNGPSLFPSETFGYRILYQNLRHNSRYRGRICVNELNRPLRPGDYYFLDYFSDILTDIFQMGQSAEYHKKRSLSECLTRLIERETVSDNTLEKFLMQYGWTGHDNYFCACLFPEERDVLTNSLPYYSNQLSENFSDICAFPYEYTIVVVSNNSLNGIEPAEFRRRIGLLLRESLMKAGISCLCNDLQKLYYMYRQAVCALEVGRKKQGTFWCFCFDDYQIDFVFYNALQEFPVEFLRCREITILQEYDKTHTSNLYETLKCYLENDRNLARTSELLDIHRTTLLYRIDRIKKLISSELDDPDERFRLWASCYLQTEARE